jgi:uncharacterized protein YjgD (DUF1641 family)
MNEPDKNGIARLQDRLSDPATAASIGRILDRLDSLESVLDRMETATAVLPGLISTVADTFDGLAARGQDAGIDLDERMKSALELTERLTQPETLGVLNRLLSRIDRLEGFLELADQAPAALSMAVDTLDDIVRKGEKRGIDLDSRLRSTFEFGEKVTSPETVDALSDVLDPGAVSIVGMVGQTLVKCRNECLAREEPLRAKGIDVLKALRSEDTQRALAFLLTFGRFWGQAMKQMHSMYSTGNQTGENDE